MPKMPKLKPCPFCKSTQVGVCFYVYGELQEVGAHGVFVERDDCQAQGPWGSADHVVNREMAEIEAALRWNYRGC